MESYKTTYLRVLIIYDDILNYHNNLGNEQDWTKKLRLIKNCLIALDIFRDSFQYFNDFIKDDKNLTQKSRDIKKQLQFVNHLRNKISGHLDKSLLEKAVQWEPTLFNFDLKSNKKARLFLTYKTLLESGINSYIDKDSKQKIFNTEIDLIYEPNQTLFLNYIGELNIDSIDFLMTILIKLEDKIKFWKKDKMMEMAHKAGMTDFKIEK